MKFRPSFTLILLASLLAALLGLVVPLQVAHASATWTLTGSLNVARGYHTATLLTNGKVLVAGGEDTTSTTSSILASAELYDPTTGSWTLTGSLNVARGFHTATLLTNGKVLVAGGSTIGSSLASAELYDPTTGSWTLTGSMNVARGGFHTATLLSNGQVLVAGGEDTSGISLASAELYDPTTGSWTLTGSMNVARRSHTATLLSNGQVLVAGGFDSNGTTGTSLASAELYDPTTGSWTLTGSMNVARYFHTATLLSNGQVLVAGGFSEFSLASAELYDPTTGSWTLTGSLNVAREGPATLLSNGQVLVAGGFDSTSGTPVTFLASAELYDPSTGSWTLTGSLNVARDVHTATLLTNGKVLVAGGSGNLSGISLASAELFSPDTTAPVLSLPGTITENATSPLGATVTYMVSASDPDDPPGQLTVTCSPPSGSTFPIGTTTVNCSASDPSGNSSSGSFQVVVNDTDLGLTNLPANITTNATSPQGKTVTYKPPTAVDESGDSPGPSASCTPASGSTFAIGTTTVTCTATDSDDTPSSVSQTFTVTVKGAAAQVSDLLTTVQGLPIASGLKASLVTQLQSVLADLQANNTAQACSDLTSFINHVKAQSGKGLTTDQANQLIAAATQIKAVLAC